MKFDSIGGHKKHIRSLKEMVVFPLTYPEVFQKFSINPPRYVVSLLKMQKKKTPKLNQGYVKVLPWCQIVAIIIMFNFVQPLGLDLSRTDRLRQVMYATNYATGLEIFDILAKNLKRLCFKYWH